MMYMIIGGASLLISLLTFFSGFGLGTLLKPVFAIFFPVDTAIVACLIDVSRLSIYTRHYLRKGIQQKGLLVLIAALCAFSGAFMGHLLLKKITLSIVQNITAIMLMGLALALGVGLI